MNQITSSFTDVFSRPADANFDSIEALLAEAKKEVEESRTVKVDDGSDISFSHENGRILLNVPGERPLPLTNYSMTQVAGMSKIQTQVLERLHERDRDDLLADNLTTLFPNERGRSKSILVRSQYDDDGEEISSAARAVNGGAYGRLWDHDMFSQMEDLLMTRGFSPNLPELRSTALRNGLMHNLDTGLFRGDQCSFGFFFRDDMSEDSEDLGGLKPGMMVWNSEVGARSFGYHTFYYHEMSGSIIIWTPSNHARKRFVHRGDVSKTFDEFVTVVEDTAINFESRYADSIHAFNSAAVLSFANSPDAAVQRLQKQFGMSASNARIAVAASQLDENNFGMPLSVWQIALGIAWEAGQTSRSEKLVDDTLIATRIMTVTLGV